MAATDLEVRKKFYRDFSENERTYLEDIVDEMRELEVEIPPHVVKRLIQREIVPKNLQMSSVIVDDNDEVSIPGIPEVIQSWDDGIIYEFSNEGKGRSANPYRIVIANELNDWTYFIKVAPNRGADAAKILDVWIRKGRMPKAPPFHSISSFDEDWDILTEMDNLEKMRHYLVDEAHAV